MNQERERCPMCDRELATQSDYDTHDDGCQCDICTSLCWAVWVGCKSEPVDWRARCLAAERERDGALANLASLRPVYEAAAAWTRPSGEHYLALAQDRVRLAALLTAAVRAAEKEVRE